MVRSNSSRQIGSGESVQASRADTGSRGVDIPLHEAGRAVKPSLREQPVVAHVGRQLFVMADSKPGVQYVQEGAGRVRTRRLILSLKGKTRPK